MNFWSDVYIKDHIHILFLTSLHEMLTFQLWCYIKKTWFITGSYERGFQKFLELKHQIHFGKFALETFIFFS